MGMHTLFDMHCHLSQMANAAEIARDAAGLGLAVFDCGVAPVDFATAKAAFTGAPNVRTGAGLHPWWISDGRCNSSDARRLADMAMSSPYVGEVGLDFSAKHVASREMQIEALELLFHALAERPLTGRVISLHAVQSATTVLDLLEETGLVGRSRDKASPAVIFHWFSGSGDELNRARKLGCYFSVNEMMLDTKRGRAYARQIPENRLLLETDAPPRLGEPYTAQALVDQLERTLTQLAVSRDAQKKTLAATIVATSARLLNMQ